MTLQEAVTLAADNINKFGNSTQGLHISKVMLFASCVGSSCSAGNATSALAIYDSVCEELTGRATRCDDVLPMGDCLC